LQSKRRGKELDLAQTKLEVLQTHSRKAKVNDLNASILTAEARLAISSKFLSIRENTGE